MNDTLSILITCGVGFLGVIIGSIVSSIIPQKNISKKLLGKFK